MALGTLAIVERVDGVGPVFHLRCSLVGDAAYGAGGSAGLLAALKTLLKDDGINIFSVHDQSIPGTVSRLEYDHATDKVFARVRTTGVESAVANQSAITYGLYIVCG